MRLTDKIITLADIPERAIEVPEWTDVETGQPMQLLLRGLTVAESRAARLKATDKHNGSINEESFAVAAVIAGAHDPATREKVFEPAHFDMLLGKSAKVIIRLGTIILRDLSMQSAEAVGEAEKNS